MVTLLADGLANVRVDTGQIEQVIMNLAVNSRDAMPQGGKLVISTVPIRINESEAIHYPGLAPGEYVMMSVADTGCGMTPEVQAHIFEPFFTTKEKGHGTGLGLAMVYGIVKQCGGYIDVESRPGKGATFKIYLPPSREAARRDDAASFDKLPKGTETILIAEDEDLVRELLAQVLSRQGFKVLQAKNGQDALQVAEKHKGPLHALISDMVMPFMGGSELVENFSPRYPQAKVLFTSGYVDHDLVEKWIKKGCRFLQKPYTPSELLHAVRRLLDNVPEGSIG
jgi:CheY-like chemotaxis protein